MIRFQYVSSSFSKQFFAPKHGVILCFKHSSDRKSVKVDFLKNLRKLY